MAQWDMDGMLPFGCVKIAMENGPVEIVSVSMKHGDFKFVM